ncbi:MAG: right-handed parallel beta-helix repeat-containing protein [Candidatus Brocadiia bacterium]
MIAYLSVLICCFLGLVTIGGQATRYVAPDGDDADPGTRDAPWRTLQHAADEAGPGDIVCIREGVYRGPVTVRNSGAPGAPITFMCAPGATVTVDGAGAEGRTGGVISVLDAGHLRILGLRVVNAERRGQSGIFLRGAHHVTVRDCATLNTLSSGIKLIESTDVVLDGNEIERACLGGAEECITVKIRSDRVEVRNNHIHHCEKEGIDIKEGARNVRVHGNRIHHVKRQGLYADAWDLETYNIEFFNNVVHDCGFGMAFCTENNGLLRDVRAYNNLIYNNGGPGIVVADWGKGETHEIRDLHIVNNTVVNNGATRKWGGGMRFENPAAHNVVVRNNIFSRNWPGQMVIHKDVADRTVDHNLIHGETELEGDEAVRGAPQFVNAGEGDFRLQSNSPAIEAGSARNAPVEDFDGNQRPRGTAVDIGAHEHHPD